MSALINVLLKINVVKIRCLFMPNFDDAKGHILALNIITYLAYNQHLSSYLIR